MLRTVSTIFAASLLAVTTASAASIQIGGTNGLTSSYIGSGNKGTVAESNYTSTLFSGATVNGSPAVPAPGATLTDSTNNVTFNLINDSAHPTATVWAGTGAAGTNEIIVPINVYGVTDVWTLLNLEDTAVVRDVNIFFTFDDANILTLKLTNGSTGQLQNSIVCLSGTCPASAYNSAAASSFSAGTTSGGIGTLTTGGAGANVITGNPYSNTVGYTGSGAYNGTSGNVVLSDQGFYFTGSALTEAQTHTLVSVTIMEASANSTQGFGLSAITVQTPEPSTILMLLSGLTLLGAGRLRRKV